MSNLDLFTGKDKTEIAIERLQAFEPKDGRGYLLAMSFGKDSIVAYDLLKRSGCRFDAEFHLAVEPPELVKFGKKHYPDVKIIKPEISIFKLIEKKGFPPTGYRRYCCEVFKEKFGEDRMVVTGVRWDESIKRKKRRMVEACYKNARIHYMNCIIDWSTEDVWNYIRTHNLPYCSLYDEGWKRLGCIGCPMGVNQKKELERWPKYKMAYLKCFNKIIEKKKEEGRDNKWICGQDIMDWWLADAQGKIDPDQTVMFE